MFYGIGTWNSWSDRCWSKIMLEVWSLGGSLELNWGLCRNWNSVPLIFLSAKLVVLDVGLHPRGPSVWPNLRAWSRPTVYRDITQALVVTRWSHKLNILGGQFNLVSSSFLWTMLEKKLFFSVFNSQCK
jgi:hypothetical protein